MPAGIEVVAQAERHVVSQVLLESQVRLLRVGVDEILCLRIAERLEGNREGRGWVQIVLVDEQVCVRRIEALLIWLVSRNGLQARTGGQDSLKDVGCIQAARTGSDSGVAGTSAREQQLAALRTVGCVAQEIQAEQRVIIKDPIRGAEHALAIASRIPCKPNARLKVVLVSLNALLQAQLIVGRESQSIRLAQLGRKLDVIANAKIEGEILPHAERVLPEQSQRFVGKAVPGISDALHQRAGNSQAVGLQPGEAGEIRTKGRRRAVRRTQV